MSRAFAAASVLGRLSTLTRSKWQASSPALTLLTVACDATSGITVNAASLIQREMGLHSFVTSACIKASPATPSSTVSAEETRQAWRPGQVESAAAEASDGHVTTTRSGVLPEMDEVVKTLEDMGLQPGRNCVVGDGVAVVDVGLYLQGVKVALQMEENRPSEADSKSYAQLRTTHTMLQAHGWHLAVLVASDWRLLDSEQKPNYLAFCINHAVGGGHKHGQGCCGGAHKQGGCGGEHKHEHGGCGSAHKHEHGGCGGEHKHEHGGCGGEHKHGHGGCGGAHKHEPGHKCKGDGSCGNHRH
ncbi:hypothetical protein Agub_g9600 [Astrephomene gubernaculifera]|uniref:Uncharacterized protein n=1 Tax=Astrephomene gubernaculifera TaxID=47775 RepID=A0AAD3HP39_9CHLO|nr:hypothetical protein Agub_g9600 [Astrephomene gubernaculifera]